MDEMDKIALLYSFLTVDDTRVFFFSTVWVKIRLHVFLDSVDQAQTAQNVQSDL